MQGRILIVEDDPELQLMFVGWLEDEKLYVQSAATAAEARRLLRKDRFHVVLLDRMLPDIKDGLDLAKDIRDTGARIVVTTCRDSSDEVQEAIDVGAGYIAKPVKSGVLVGMVKSLLREGEGIDFNGWSINEMERRLTDPAGKAVKIGDAAFDILYGIARMAPDIATFAHIAKHVGTSRGAAWGPSPEAIRQHIKAIRTVLGDRDMIRSVTGIGYRLVLA